MGALTIRDTTMARPRKVDGPLLPANLYPDNKGRPDHYRYRREDGKFRTLKATLEQACQIAEQANALRHEQPGSVFSLEHWRNKYKAWAEEQQPALTKKQSWTNRTNEMKAFCKEFKSLTASKITLQDIEPWWDNLTYDQQHNRRAAFSKWFLWMMNKGVAKCNPFANTEDRPSLINKKKPEKARLPLTIDDFWATYRAAGKLSLDYVQIAMGISLVTMMRESDICSLQLDQHVIENHLKKSIEKSVNQRGTVGASHLDFDLDKHLLLKKLINRARELSLQHQRCPYILSYKPKQKRLGKTKTHTHQVTARMLIDGFAEAREATGRFTDIPEDKTPPTFHEIKGLAIYRAEKRYELAKVQEQAAHTDPRVTKGYTAQQEPQWVEASVIFDEELIGGAL